jgi:hypothetical protein
MFMISSAGREGYKLRKQASNVENKMATTMTTTTTTTITSASKSTSPQAGRFSLSSLPPFPQDVPTAPLVRLSFAKLQAREPDEVRAFTRACEDIGFFYLDLSPSPPSPHSSGGVSGASSPTVATGNGTGVGAEDFVGSRISRDVDALFDVAEQLYDLPVEEKSRYDFTAQKSYFGYKGYGANVADREGNLDRNEFYNVCPRVCPFFSFLFFSFLP